MDTLASLVQDRDLLLVKLQNTGTPFPLFQNSRPLLPSVTGLSFELCERLHQGCIRQYLVARSAVGFTAGEKTPQTSVRLPLAIPAFEFAGHPQLLLCSAGLEPCSRSAGEDGMLFDLIAV